MMYTPLRLVFKYIGHYLKASNGKGHGVHSPFVFSFINNVLKSGKSDPVFDKIEKLRKKLLADSSLISVRDYGAGSAVIRTDERIVKKIAASSLKPARIARMLYRMVLHFKPVNIVELGTSFGITTSYLASAGKNTPVYTIEGDPSIASIALKNFTELDIKNIKLIRNSFDEVLPSVLNEISQAGLVFIDGHHRKEATLKYFEMLLPFSGESGIIIFDDIHWSKEMEEAWEEIKRHSRVTLSIDLFYVGIVFFKNEFKVKQHFSIRF